MAAMACYCSYIQTVLSLSWLYASGWQLHMAPAGDTYGDAVRVLHAVHLWQTHVM
jgi:hypothetical protein